MRLRVIKPAPHVQQEERFKLCVLIKGTITRPFCTALSRVPSKNRDGCTNGLCWSPWRLCAACIREDNGLTPSVVEKIGSRLCTFHAVHGEGVTRPQKPPAPKQEPVLVAELPQLKPEPAPRTVLEPELQASEHEPSHTEDAQPEDVPEVPEPDSPAEVSRDDASEISEPVPYTEGPMQVSVIAAVADKVPAFEMVEEAPNASGQETADKLKPEPEGGTATDEEWNTFASCIRQIEGRQMKVLVAVMGAGLEAGAHSLGMQVASAQAYLNMVCNQIGIPRTKGYPPTVRVGMLQRAWEIHMQKQV
jgi:hypothetical protein